MGQIWSRHVAQEEKSEQESYEAGEVCKPPKIILNLKFAEIFTAQLKIFFVLSITFCGHFIFVFARFLKWTHSLSFVCSQQGTFISVRLYHVSCIMHMCLYAVFLSHTNFVLKLYGMHLTVWHWLMVVYDEGEELSHL